jgi:dTDP-4-amino-4,6-dideoxygalactose transaminase
MFPFTDLKAQYVSIKQEIDRAIQKVIDEGNYILGPEVKQLEQGVAAYCGTSHAVGVASGTDALVLALMAAGIKSGDKVITTPLTFVATTEAISRVGAVPVFVDVDENTYNINADLIEKKIDSSVKALLPVHLYGQSCDMDKITAVSAKYGLKLIEDCAQSIGTEFKGKKAGSFGDAGCLSFFPAKTLGCYGDGGMVVTNNPDIADKVSILRKHGSRKKNYLDMHGINSRLDTLQAAVLVVKLKYLNSWIEKRRANAAIYNEYFSKLSSVAIPMESAGTKHSFNYYTLKLKDQDGRRDKLEKYLLDNGISCGVYYPVSMHLQQIYSNLGYKKGDLPVSEKLQDTLISLPMYPELTRENIAMIAGKIADFFGKK